jgi:hypothetical protein
MRTIIGIRAALASTTLSLASWPATHGWAQVILDRQAGSQAPAGAPSGAMTTAAIVASAVAVLVILGALAKATDLRRKRDLEAVDLQARISDAMLRDPRLFGLPITVTAQVPLWTGAPVTVTAAGLAPSEDLRQAALRLIEREASRARPDSRVESRIDLAPAMVQRSA